MNLSNVASSCLLTALAHRRSALLLLFQLSASSAARVASCVSCRFISELFFTLFSRAQMSETAGKDCTVLHLNMSLTDQEIVFLHSRLVLLTYMTCTRVILIFHISTCNPKIWLKTCFASTQWFKNMKYNTRRGFEIIKYILFRLNHSKLLCRPQRTWQPVQLWLLCKLSSCHSPGKVLLPSTGH